MGAIASRGTWNSSFFSFLSSPASAATSAAGAEASAIETSPASSVLAFLSFFDFLGVGYEVERTTQARNDVEREGQLHAAA